MFDGVKMILIFVVAGMVDGGALDFLIQLLFQLLIVRFCTLNISVLGGVNGLPGHLCCAAEQDTAGGKAGHDQQDEQKKNAHDHQNVRVALCGSCQTVDGCADCTFSLVDYLLHARLCGRCAAGCSLFAACGLRRRAARPGSGIVALANILLLSPPGKPVGAALTVFTVKNARISCILCLVWLAGRRFCGAGFFLCLHLGFLFQLSGVAILGKVLNIPGGFFALAQRLHTDIIFFVLVDFPVRRRPGKGSGVHLAFLLLAQSAQIVRGQFSLAKAEVLRLFLGFVRGQLQFFLFGLCLLDLCFLRGRTGLFCGRFLFEVQLRIAHFCAPSETSPSLVVIMRYSSKSVGKRSTKGRMTLPKNSRPSPSPEWVT